jgi:hypothetical protein
VAFPLCKLITLTAPVGAPDRVVMSTIVGTERFEIRRPTLVDGEFDFDDEDLIPFQNEVQLKFGLNVLGGTHRDLGVVIVSADDVNKGELKQRFGQLEPIYELTYKVLP